MREFSPNTPKARAGRISQSKNYETLKKAILSSLRNKEPTHTELFEKLEKRLRPTFSGNTSWYGETVKLDLEARNIIERIGSRPEKLRLKLMEARR